MEVKKVTIRIPHNLWVELRRAQEKGYIKSIQGACITGLRNMIFSLSMAEKANETRGKREKGG